MNVPGPEQDGPEDLEVPAAIDRRRLDEIFGDVLPESTSDDRDHAGSGDGGLGDSWFTENRPPHHGG